MPNTITIDGRLGDDPVLRFTQSGKAVANMRIAHSKRKQVDGEWVDDGPTIWLDVTVWEGRAERLVEQAHKGDELLVTGRLVAREYDGKIYFGVQADGVAVIRAKGEKSSAPTSRQGASDPWANVPNSDDEPPY